MWGQFHVQAWVCLCPLLVNVVLGLRATIGVTLILFLGVAQLEEFSEAEDCGGSLASEFMEEHRAYKSIHN